jgi:hypothetical protein
VVVTCNIPQVVPELAAMADGTLATAALLLESVSTVPREGAVAFIPIDPFRTFPPTTELFRKNR